MIKYLLKEPLFIFLLIGGSLFVIFDLVSNHQSTDKQEIVISAGNINALVLGFEKVWQRAPNKKELDGLIQNFIKEEVLYREAIAMKLDENDGIVRRRLSQKMEFISEDLASIQKPTDEELQAYLEVNAKQYLQDSRYSFQHIYFNRNKRGETVYTDAESALVMLKASQINTTQKSKAIDKALGDPLMIKSHFNDVTASQVKRELGMKFVQSLDKLSLNNWQGPIESGFGLHLVKVDKHTSANLPTVSEVRKSLERDWNVAQRKEGNKAFYQALRSRYTVSIDHLAIQQASIEQMPIKETAIINKPQITMTTK